MFSRALALAAVLFFGLSQVAFANPIGIWSRASPAGETKIQIEECEQQYCGTVVWMENPRNDTENPDPELRDRPIVGIQIFNDMVKISDTQWNGSLYNPENGKTYSGSLIIINSDTLKLQGCIIWPLCKTDVWTRSEL